MEKEEQRKKDKPSVILCILLGILFLYLGLEVGARIAYRKTPVFGRANAPCAQAFDCECPPQADYCDCLKCEDDETCTKTYKVKCYKSNHYTTTKGD